MINDTDSITLDKDLKLVLINEDPIIDIFRSQLGDRIKEYIAFYDIAPVGVTIIANNAKLKISEPSGEGTTLNLYNLLYAYFNFDLS